MIGADFETFKIEPGILAPRGVCASFADEDGGFVVKFREGGLEIFGKMLRSSEVMAGANLAYDFAVAAASDPDLLEAIFDKLERGEVHDVQIAMALDAIAGGHLFEDPNGGPLRGPPGPNGEPGEVQHRYNLRCVHYYLTGEDAKENAEWRLRYGELDDLPIEAWPEPARLYPVDDAVNARRDALLQLQHHTRNLGMIEGKDWTHLTHQCRAAWVMHLGAVWGLRVDVPRITALVEKVIAERSESEKALLEKGFLKTKIKKVPTQNTCRTCLGTTKGLNPKGKEINCKACRGSGFQIDEVVQVVRNQASVKTRIVTSYGGSLDAKCPACNGTAKVKSEKSGNPINCKRCSATGLDLPDDVPRTPTEGVKGDADTLNHSADADLEELADYSETEKIVTTYGPALLSSNGAPLNIRSNVLVATTRASYEGIIQLMPKKFGVRECLIPRPGFVYCSVDYNALELSTLAQTCITLFGWSDMADAINADKDLHSMLAAEMVGGDYETLKRAVKAEDAVATNYRFAAKAGNFGFGGLMGAPKFVITQRKAKIADHGSMCRLGGVEHVPCGTEKITKWKGRPCPPVCKACTEFSESLRKAWLAKWREMPEYFNWVGNIPGVQDGEGVIKTPLTGFVRGGLNASAAANHSFQHIAAMGAKHAFWKVSREAYTRRSSPLWGTRVVIFSHDELIAEIPEEVMHDAAFRMAEVMIGAMREFVPQVKVGAVPALMRRWYKAAKDVYDGNGKLIPWEPKAVAA